MAQNSTNAAGERRDDLILQAMVSAYALMAHADGELANAERRRFLSIVRETPALEAFSKSEIDELVATHEANFRFDPEIARQFAWEKLDPVGGQRRAVHVVLAACRELIAADGIAHPAEFRALAAIKSRLGVDGLPSH